MFEDIVVFVVTTEFVVVGILCVDEYAVVFECIVVFVGVTEFAVLLDGCVVVKFSGITEVELISDIELPFDDGIPVDVVVTVV